MQRITLQREAALSGPGLFTAQQTAITIAPADDGISYSLQGQHIPASIEALSTRPPHPIFQQLKPRCTTLGSHHCTVATIEHIMSALTGLGITDARINIDAPQPHTEIPIIDGSAKPFVDAILAAGTTTLPDQIDPIRIAHPIEIIDSDASIIIEPSDTPSYSYTIEYPDTPIESATVTWNANTDDYINTIAPARTFSLEHEAQQMQSLGLFTHLTPRDMLVIGPQGPIDNQYRVANECANHKLLDLIGDLALVGKPLIAKVTATRSGHAMAHQAARAIVDQHRSNKK